MKLIANKINSEYLKQLVLDGAAIEEMKVAVAYASGNPELFAFCHDNNIKLTFYCRYDNTVPVSPAILKWFLDKKSPNYVCKLVPDHFHSKIIWLVGHCVYIGSANLTKNGWYSNVETGVLLNDTEIIENNLSMQIEFYFDELDEMSHPLTLEIYEELVAREITIRKMKQVFLEYEKEIIKTRIIQPKPSPISVTFQNKLSKKKDAFLKEWSDTLQILRDISDRVSIKHKPEWVDGNVPSGVQGDQFLHAFYYKFVVVKNAAKHHQFHEKNKNNPEQALVEAMLWWESTTSPPSNEDRTFDDMAPFVKTMTAENKLLSLTLDEFSDMCGKVHALRDHSLRVKYTSYGLLEKLPHMQQEERVRVLSEYLYRQRSLQGKTPLETLYYLLYGDNLRDLPSRLWDAVTSKEWRISHLGISSLGEIVGWALPDHFPPRNGRTSKALFALGYKVKIHSE